MKIPTAEAARRLGTHPANVVLYISEMVGELSDCWPEIDEGLVDTLRALRFREDRPTPPTHPEAKPIPAPQRSETQLKVLDKLERHDKWGGNSVSFRTLRNNYCHGLPDLQEAIDALVREGLLVSGEGRERPYSLNPSRKGEIERIVSRLRQRSPG